MANDEKKVPFGSRLEQLRTARKLTLRELAERAGYDHTLISRIERREKPASADVLTCIAGALGVPLGDLVADTDAEATLATPPKAAGNPFFQGVLGVLIGKEATVGDLQAKIRTLSADNEQLRKAREDAEYETRSALASIDRLTQENEMLVDRLRARKEEIARVRELLTQAAGEVADLKAKAAELSAGLGKSLWQSIAFAGALKFLMEFNTFSDTTLAKLFDVHSLFEADLDLLPRPYDSLPTPEGESG